MTANSPGVRERVAEARLPRTKTGRWLLTRDGLAIDLLSYFDGNGDPIDLREMVCRIEDEAQSMRWEADR